MQTDSEQGFVSPETHQLIPEPVEQTQADLRSNELNEINDVLTGKSPESLSAQSLSLFVPKKVYEIAKDSRNIEIRPIGSEKTQVSVLVLEKNAAEGLTNPEAWKQWEENYAAALDEQAGKAFRKTPPAPGSVNRLHAKFKSEIDKGELSINDRILMTVRVGIYRENPQALMVGDFDGEPHQGIGQDFYKNVLPQLARNLGLRFIIGDNRTQNVSFFTETLGRYTLDQLKPEYQETLFPGRAGWQDFTIQFLYPEDAGKYVEKDKIR